MALDIVVQSLLKVALFRGLKPLQVAEVARQADRIVYRPGQSIITEGEPGDAAILLVQGDAVRVGVPSTPGEAVLDGALIGELAMLVETVHGCTVVSRGTTRAIRIRRAALREQMDQDPAVAVILSNNLVQRLTAVARDLARIDQMLAGLPEFAGTSVPPSLLIDAGRTPSEALPVH